MADLFLYVLNLSITASWIVLAVVILRYVLKDAPKWTNCVLWGIVGLRLIFPFSLLSIFPDPAILWMRMRNINTKKEPENFGFFFISCGDFSRSG